MGRTRRSAHFIGAFETRRDGNWVRGKVNGNSAIRLVDAVRRRKCELIAEVNGRQRQSESEQYQSQRGRPPPLRQRESAARSLRHRKPPDPRTIPSRVGAPEQAEQGREGHVILSFRLQSVRHFIRGPYLPQSDGAVQVVDPGQP